MEIKDDNSTVQGVAIALLLLVLALGFWYAGGTTYVADHVSAAEDAWSDTGESNSVTTRLKELTGVDQMFSSDSGTSEEDAEDLVDEAEEELAKSEGQDDEA